MIVEASLGNIKNCMGRESSVGLVISVDVFILVYLAHLKRKQIINPNSYLIAEWG